MRCFSTNLFITFSKKKMGFPYYLSLGESARACILKGVIGEKELRWINRQEREIIDNWKHIISDFDLLLKSSIVPD